MRFLGPGKTVVITTEVEQILREIGPVDTGGNAQAQAPADVPGDTAGAAPARRLYQIREGAMVSGVCNGLGRTSTWIRRSCASRLWSLP